MRKSSKILAVVIAVALLCAAIATMVSATASEIIYPEYTAPSAAAVYTNYSSDFEEGSALPGSFSASNGFMRKNITAGGNTYAQITNINADGTLATHTSRSMMNLFSPYQVIGKWDYLTVSFDLAADKYTDGTNIITPEQYKAAVFASQQRVEGVGYLSNIIENHDEPRGVSHYIPQGELTEQGKAIIMISSELPEVLGMSDRVIVMHEGHIKGQLSREEADQVSIMKMAVS